MPEKPVIVVAIDGGKVTHVYSPSAGGSGYTVVYVEDGAIASTEECQTHADINRDMDARLAQRVMHQIESAASG